MDVSIAMRDRWLGDFQGLNPKGRPSDRYNETA